MNSENLKVNNFSYLELLEAETLASTISAAENLISRLIGNAFFYSFIIDENMDFVLFKEEQLKSKEHKNIIDSIFSQGIFGDILESNDSKETVLKEINQARCLITPYSYRGKILGISLIIPADISGFNACKDYLQRILKVTAKNIYIAAYDFNKDDICENCYEYISQNVEEGIFFLDSGFNIIRSNKGAQVLTALSAQEINSRNFKDLFSGKSLSIIQEFLTKPEKTLADLELSLQGNPKKKIIVKLNLQRFYSPEKNTFYVAMIRDLSAVRELVESMSRARLEIENQNKNLEDEVAVRTREITEKVRDARNLSEFLTSILESMDSGVIAVDVNGRINTINNSGRKILDLDFDVKGLSYRSLPHLTGISRFITETLGYGNEVKGVKAEIKKINGDIIDVSLSTSLLRSVNGELRGLVLIFADQTSISKLHQKMITAQRMADLGQMAASVAHELSGPMNVIRGLAEIVIDRDVDRDKTLQYMNVITGQIDRLEDLVKQVLEYARPMKLDFKQVALGEFIQPIVNTFKEGVTDRSGKDIVIETHLTVPDPLVFLDRNSIEQIILNLLKNSLDAIDKKGVIEVFTRKKSGRTTLSVKDNGCGIFYVNQEKILEAFYTTKKKGTGLGLAIVKNIVEAHNATLKINSEKNKGTEIIIKFPE